MNSSKKETRWSFITNEDSRRPRGWSDDVWAIIEMDLMGVEEEKYDRGQAQVQEQAVGAHYVGSTLKEEPTAEKEEDDDGMLGFGGMYVG